MEAAILPSSDPMHEWGLFFQTHHRKFFSFVYVRTRDRDLAEDMVQDAFCKVCTAVQTGRYRDDGKPLPWVMRVLHNMFIDHTRKQKKLSLVRPTTDVIAEYLISVPNLLLSKEQEIQNLEIEDTIKRLIDTLPSEQREVVTMRMYLKMKFADIAEYQGVSINTALGRMRYALINLRKVVKKHNIDLDGYLGAPD